MASPEMSQSRGAALAVALAVAFAACQRVLLCGDRGCAVISTVKLRSPPSGWGVEGAAAAGGRRHWPTAVAAVRRAFLLHLAAPPSLTTLNAKSTVASGHSRGRKSSTHCMKIIEYLLNSSKLSVMQKYGISIVLKGS